MKRLFFLSLILFMASCLSEDGIDVGQPSTFIKFFSDGYSNEAVAIEELEDGGFVILMNSTIKNSDADQPKEKIILVRIDQFGTEIGRDYYPPLDSNTRRWRAHAITLLDDGGYLITGESINDIKSDLLVMRADSEGNLDLANSNSYKEFVYPYSTVGRATTIFETTGASNGNFLFLAASENPTGRMLVGELSKTDLSQVWSISRGEDAVSELTTRLFYNVAGDELIYWGGTVIKTVGERSDIRLTKNPINTIPGGDPNIGASDKSEVANDMCLSGNVFAFVGSIDTTAQNNNSEIYFYKGGDKKKYTKEFIKGNPGFNNDKNEEANSISTTKDGGFIILATIDTYTGVIGRGNTDILLMKVNGFGDYQWSVPYGTINADNGKAVRQTSDGGFVAISTSTLAGITTVMLVKTDKGGNVD